MQQVASLYKTYGYTGDSMFTANCQQLNQDTTALETWIMQTNANPLGTASYPNPPQSVLNGTPAAQYSVETTSTPWGGSTSGETSKSKPTSANAFYDLATSGVPSSNPTNASNNSSNPSTPISLALRPVLASIDLWGGDWMNQLGTSYQTTSGTVQFVHGDPSGSGLQPSLNLQTGEFVTSISGQEDWYVNKLTFTTNRGQSLTGPPNGNAASSFSWSVPSGATLVGFQGSCGEYLNTLQPVFIQFQPASWTRYASVAQYVPAGSYQLSSSDLSIEIQAQCCTESGDTVLSTLQYTSTEAFGIQDIGNINGVLTIVSGNANILNGNNSLGSYIPAGSYQQSSSNITVTLSANCLNISGQSVPSSLTYTASDAASFSTIMNDNGVLTSVSTT
jgi:hypothetical protein